MVFIVQTHVNTQYCVVSQSKTDADDRAVGDVNDCP